MQFTAQYFFFPKMGETSTSTGASTLTVGRITGMVDEVWQATVIV